MHSFSLGLVTVESAIKKELVPAMQMQLPSPITDHHMDQAQKILSHILFTC